jgi:hypothetical protein
MVVIKMYTTLINWAGLKPADEWVSEWVSEAKSTELQWSFSLLSSTLIDTAYNIFYNFFLVTILLIFPAIQVCTMYKTDDRLICASQTISSIESSFSVSRNFWEGDRCLYLGVTKEESHLFIYTSTEKMFLLHREA